MTTIKPGMNPFQFQQQQKGAHFGGSSTAGSNASRTAGSPQALSGASATQGITAGPKINGSNNVMPVNFGQGVNLTQPAPNVMMGQGRRICTSC